MRISSKFEKHNKKIQEFAKLEGIHDIVLQLEEVCLQAYNELEEEINIIKNI
ncbi:hypothetical protein [Flavobacterium sp. LB1P71]|uniref:hypothetical protein n=1 Tax=Flavobacterium sp. LB1P71 TaxID=3401716 RepID=UPI003AB0FACC